MKFARSALKWTLGILTLSSQPASCLPAPENSNLSAKATSYSKIKPAEKYLLELDEHNDRSTVQQLEDDVRLHPNSATPYLRRGNYYLLSLEGQKALKDFNKALAVDSTSALAHVGRSRVYADMGRWAQVHSELEEAQKKGNPDVSARALWESAYLYRKLKDLEPAIQQYKKLLKHDFKSAKLNALVRLQLGIALSRAGENKQALTYLNQAGSNMDVYRARAQLYFAERLFERSLSDYTRAIDELKKLSATIPAEMDVDSGQLANLYLQRAIVYKQLKRFDMQARDLKLAQTARERTFEIAPFQIR